MIHWCDVHYGFCSVFGSIVMIAITVALVKVTRSYAKSAAETVTEMRKQRDEMQRQRVEDALPVLMVRWHEIPDHSTTLALVNEGSGTALNIRAKWMEMPTRTQTGVPTDCYVPALRAGGLHSITAYPVQQGHHFEVTVGYEDLYGNRFVSKCKIGYIIGMMESEFLRAGRK